MLGSSCHLQVECCEERELSATASQLRSWFWDLPAAHRSSLAKHWFQGGYFLPKDQLPDGALVIGDNTRKYLALLKLEKQKAALLSICAFWGAAWQQDSQGFRMPIKPFKERTQVYNHLHPESFKETVTRIRHCSSLGWVETLPERW